MYDRCGVAMSFTAVQQQNELDPSGDELITAAGAGDGDADGGGGGGGALIAGSELEEMLLIENRHLSTYTTTDLNCKLQTTNRRPFLVPDVNMCVMP